MEKALNGTTLRVFLNPTIVMEKICYLKKEWESGRVGEWESGRGGEGEI